MMAPEVYFLRYAFACTESKVHCGKIKREEFENLMDSFIRGNPVERSVLERVYPDAAEGIKESAKIIGKSMWDLESIAHYFLIRHNEIINQGLYGYGEYPETQKEFCRVRKAEVVRKDEGILVVKFLDTKQEGIVINLILKNIEKGEYVNVHQRYACELLSRDSIAEKYRGSRKEVNT